MPRSVVQSAVKELYSIIKNMNENIYTCLCHCCCCQWSRVRDIILFLKLFCVSNTVLPLLKCIKKGFLMQILTLAHPAHYHHQLSLKVFIQGCCLVCDSYWCPFMWSRCCVVLVFVCLFFDCYTYLLLRTNHSPSVFCHLSSPHLLSSFSWGGHHYIYLCHVIQSESSSDYRENRK